MTTVHRVTAIYRTVIYRFDCTIHLGISADGHYLNNRNNVSVEELSADSCPAEI